MKKVIFFSLMCLTAVATIGTIASCDKESTGTSGGGAGYVDLGLPSGTKWKTTNETNPNDENSFYTYDEAMAAFGSKLPTKEQFMELRNSCEWTWTGMGYKVVGTNGNYITLPAAGGRSCYGDVYDVGSYGGFWSSTPNGSDNAWYLYFNSGEVDMYDNNRCYGQSVRLVQD